MILYGLPGHYKDVTLLARKHFRRGNCICIPSTDIQRAKVFGDHLPGTVKHVKVTFPNAQVSIYPSGVPARIALVRKPYKYYLTIVAATHSDARFLPEWLEFHLQVGAEHFYIYDNESPDNTREILTPYIAKGLVTYVRWPDKDPVVLKGRDNGFRRAKKESHWVAMIDTDEFIVPNRVEDLRILLRKYEGYAALAMNWQMFGTSGVQQVPPDKLMIETLTRSLPPKAKAKIEWTPGEWVTINKYIKSIVNSQYTSGIVHPHQGTYHGSYAVDSKCRGRNNVFMPICIDDLQLNHYFFRDRKFMKEVKLERRNRFFKNYGLRRRETVKRYLKTDIACSSTSNLSAQRFVAPVRARLKL